MLKVVVLSSIFIMCVSMGFVKKKEIYIRSKELEELIFFAENLKDDIFYRKIPIDKIIVKEELSNLNLFFLKMAESQIHPILNRYESVKEEVSGRMFLNKEDWDFLDKLFYVLGKTDEGSQYDILDRFLKELREHKKNITVQNEKMGSFYVKIWFAIGTLFVIICV